VLQALAFTEADWRAYCAVHELGHALAGLRSGLDATYSVLTTDGSDSAGHTHLVWGDNQHGQLVMLAAGAIAQRKWLEERGQLTPLRAAAVRACAVHDDEHTRRLRATPAERAAAQSEAEALLDEVWPALHAGIGPLTERGRLDGGELRALLSDSSARPDHHPVGRAAMSPNAPLNPGSLTMAVDRNQEAFKRELKAIADELTAISEQTQPIVERVKDHATDLIHIGDMIAIKRVDAQTIAENQDLAATLDDTHAAAATLGGQTIDAVKSTHATHDQLVTSHGGIQEAALSSPVDVSDLDPTFITPQ
jgi:hypothetical protein